MLNKETMIQLLNQVYAKTLEGIGGNQSVLELAQDYLRKHEDPEQAIQALIRFQNTKAFTSGFLSGAAGLILMPVTVPANLVNVLYMQIRMVAAIAHIRGYDLNSDQVKTMVFATLTGGSALRLVKNAAIKVAKEVLEELLQKVAIQIAARSGAQLPVQFAKAVPLVGGIVGGAFDLASTHSIGQVAKKMFIQSK